MNEHDRWLIQQSVDHAVVLDEQLASLQGRVEEKLTPYRKQIDLLVTIPGIQETVQLGRDLFGEPSVGRQEQGESHQEASKFLLAALVEASWGAARTKDSAF